MKTIILAFFLLSLVNATAAIHQVNVENFKFIPNELETFAGDTVQFVWINGTHPVASDNEAWEEFMIDNENQSFNLIIDQAGVFPYYCTLHGSPGGIGMAGTINVDNISGKSELLENQSAQINPYIAEDVLHIELYEIIIDNVQIVNLEGKIIDNIPVQNVRQVEANVHEASGGLYFLQFLRKGKVINTKKIIID